MCDNSCTLSLSGLQTHGLYGLVNVMKYTFLGKSSVTRAAFNIMHHPKRKVHFFCRQFWQCLYNLFLYVLRVNISEISQFLTIRFRMNMFVYLSLSENLILEGLYPPNILIYGQQKHVFLNPSRSQLKIKDQQREIIQ